MWPIPDFLNARPASKRRRQQIRNPLLRPLMAGVSDRRRLAPERAKYDLWIRTGRRVPQPLYKRNAVRSAGQVYLAHFVPYPDFRWQVLRVPPGAVEDVTPLTMRLLPKVGE
jgi:hypothetical protein